MLKLKLQHFGHLMQRADTLEKTLMLGKTEGNPRSGQQRMRWLDGTIDAMDMSMNKLRGTVEGGSLACSSPQGRKGPDATEWTMGTPELQRLKENPSHTSKSTPTGLLQSAKGWPTKSYASRKSLLPEARHIVSAHP